LEKQFGDIELDLGGPDDLDDPDDLGDPGDLDDPGDSGELDPDDSGDLDAPDDGLHFDRFVDSARCATCDDDGLCHLSHFHLTLPHLPYVLTGAAAMTSHNVVVVVVVAGGDGVVRCGHGGVVDSVGACSVGFGELGDLNFQNF
jgi:hypothetical protein